MLFFHPDNLIRISGLPSLVDLQAFRNAGISTLLNVSGVNIMDIYPEDALAFFSITQLTFADLFTSGSILKTVDGIGPISTNAYLQVSCEDERHALLAAVQMVAGQLQSQTPTWVFCHRGLGRSPLVVAAAFLRFYRVSVKEAVAKTRAIHAPAQFTDISLSALKWCAKANDRVINVI